MRSQDERWPAAALAAGLVALAALLGCGGEPGVAGKSATAFREAQKKGETFAGGEHANEHGAMTPGEEHEMPGEKGMAGMDHSGMAHGGKAGMAGMAGMPGMGHAGTTHGGMQGMAGMDHSRMAQGGQGGMAGMDHSRMTQGSQGSMPGMEHSAVPSATLPPAPVAVLPEQPARTLRPDPLDAPAATSVLDAQRAAEMAEGMAGMTGGGHGGHGSGTYRQVDAGREPAAGEGSESVQPPSAEPHQHDHQAPRPPAERRQG